MSKIVVYGGIIVLVVLAVWWGPLACIWAVNTLFSLVIPYTLKTWAAALILGSPFAASRVSKRD